MGLRLRSLKCCLVLPSAANGKETVYVYKRQSSLKTAVLLQLVVLLLQRSDIATATRTRRHSQAHSNSSSSNSSSRGDSSGTCLSINKIVPSCSPNSAAAGTAAAAAAAVRWSAGGWARICNETKPSRVLKNSCQAAAAKAETAAATAAAKEQL